MNECPPNINPYDITEVSFAGRIPVNVLLFRRMKHDFEKGWEKEYLNAIIDELKPTMKVWDIGAEQGEFTAMIGKIVGGGNVSIFEPTGEYWANIKRLWDANSLECPQFCFEGYVSDQASESTYYKMFELIDSTNIFCETKHVIPSETPKQSTTIDAHCLLAGNPDMIVMDIEGAELSAIRGGLATLMRYSPIVFISVHSDELMQMRSGGTKEDLFNTFRMLGYSATHIYTDHEEHWKFVKL